MSVSVIIPTYNRAHMVTDAIDSVLCQEYKDCEIIVVDDGSTDNTADVLQAYGDAITCLRQKNRGAGPARNRALAIAQGDYIAFLDSDDMWLDFKLQLQVEIMDRLPDVGFLYSEFSILKEDGGTIRQGSRTWHERPVDWSKVYERKVPFSSLGISVGFPEKDFAIHIGRIYRKLLHDPYILPSSALIRSSCVTDEVRFSEELSMYEDWQFFSRLSRRCDGAFMDLETTVNRGHDEPGRLTRCGALNKHTCRLTLIDNVWKSDVAFMAQYGTEVGELENSLLLKKAQAAILESRRDIARAALAQWRRNAAPSEKSKAAVLRLLSHIPGSGGLARLARSVSGRGR